MSVEAKAGGGDDKTLPIRRFAEDIIAAVGANSTVTIIGETGSGKTTQLSQILLDAKLAEDGMIAITQPRRVGAVSVAKRVAEERCCALGAEVGYAVRFEDRSSRDTRIKYLTDGTLLRECLEDALLTKYKIIILDEAHERSLNTDVLFGVLKRLLKRRMQANQPLKLVVTSATLDGEKFSAYFHDCPVFNVPGRCFPVDIIYAREDHFKDYVSAAIDTVLQIHINKPPGDILVFLTGQAEIEKAIAKIHSEVANLPGGSCGALLALPLHASLPPELQVRVFRPPPEGVRRVIVATNVAETSVTVEGVVYVVDAGVVKQKHYQPATGMDSLDVVPISRVGATQRAGRAGRTRAGTCYRLYTKMFYEGQMPSVTLPEIQRTSLVSAVLYLKSLELDDLDVLTFDFLDPPSRESLEDALRQLYSLDAITADGTITPMGRRMSALPLDPSLARALIEAERLGCVPEVITIGAMLSSEHVFAAGQGPGDARPGQAQESAGHGDGRRGGAQAGPREKLRALVARGEGDHILLLRLWEAWEASGCSRECSQQYGLDLRGMNFARDIRRQLESVVREGRLGPGGAAGRKRSREEEEHGGPVPGDRAPGRSGATDEARDRDSRRSGPGAAPSPSGREGAPPRSLSDAQRVEAARRALTVGFANKIARRVGSHGYKTLGAKAQLANLHPACSGLKEDEDGLLPEWVLFHELVSTSRPFLRQVCPTRHEYVEPLLKKMMGLDVRRLSRGSALDPGSGAPGSAAASEADQAGPAAAATAVKRNDDVSVNAARQRYLERKAQQSAAARKK